MATTDGPWGAWLEGKSGGAPLPLGESRKGKREEGGNL